MDVRLPWGKKNAKKERRKSVIVSFHVLGAFVFYSRKCSHSVPCQTYFYIYEANLLLVAYGKGFAAQITRLCTNALTFTSVWFLTVFIHHSFKSWLRFCEKKINSWFVLHISFVCASCNTLAMQISLLWCYILVGLLWNVSYNCTFSNGRGGENAVGMAQTCVFWQRPLKKWK